MQRPDLSVVIPVFNEEKRIPSTLKDCLATLRARKAPSEVLVVDDGSKDSTLTAVRTLGRLAKGKVALRVLRHGVNRGKGAAVRTGALAAKGRVVLYMDADNSTRLSEYDRFRPALAAGAQVVVGSRALDRSTIQVHQPIHREAMGRIFNLMVQVAAVPGVWDTQCGFKAFTREAAVVCFPLQTIDRFGFDPEVLFIARRKGFRIQEVSVRWYDSPQSKVSVFRDSTRMFLDLWRIRRNAWKGLYGPSGKNP